jgi:vitamin B12 transporter
MSEKLFLILALFVTLADANAQTDTGSLALEEITVTANRFPQKQQSTGKVLSVIPRSVLEKSPGRSVGDILNQYAGLTVAGTYNAPGTNPDVYLRGASTGNTLVLIDGIPAYDASTIASTFDLNHFPTGLIERIEILKGAQSTQYGSDAVAGVINIITRSKTQRPVNLNASLSAGSFGGWQIQTGLHGRSGRHSYQAGYQHVQSDGFSAAQDSTAKGSFDRDGIVQDIISASYSFLPGPKTEWTVSGRSGWYKNDLDAAAFTDEKDFRARNRNLLAGMGLKQQLGRGYLQFNYQYNSSNRYYVDDSAYVSGLSTYSQQDYTGRSHFAELYASLPVHEKLSFLTGMDYRIQNTDQYFLSVSSYGPFESTLSSDSASIHMYSAYASAYLTLPAGIRVEAGGRYNNHSRFGDQFTFTINPFISFAEQWKIFLNLSSAFKAPSLYQLFDAYSGNTNLLPESSHTLEAGIQYIHVDRSLDLRLVFFGRRIENGIDYSYTDYRYFNNNRQKDYGLEWEATYRKNKWQAAFNYSYVNGEVNTVKYVYDPQNFVYVADGDTTYYNLFRRPKHSINLNAGYHFTPAFYLSGSLRIAGKRLEPRFGDIPVSLDSYQLVDLYAAYTLKNQITFFADLRNVLNQDYADASGYNTRPRNFQAGIRCAL